MSQSRQALIKLDCAHERGRKKGKQLAFSGLERELGWLAAAGAPPAWSSPAPGGWTAARNGSEKAAEPCPNGGCEREHSLPVGVPLTVRERGLQYREKSQHEPAALSSPTLLLWEPEEAFCSSCFSKMGFFLMTPSLPLVTGCRK